MAIELNHTIVLVRDRVASASFLTEILGSKRRSGSSEGARGAVEERRDRKPAQHRRKRSDDGSKPARISSCRTLSNGCRSSTGEQIPYFADPAGRHAQEINHGDGGRGFYWADPNGHWYEVLTRPYGSSTSTG